MKLPCSEQEGHEGLTFLEVLCALALISVLGLCLVSLQRVVLNTALDTVLSNTQEQNLNTVQNRLMLYIPFCSAVSKIPATATNSEGLTIDFMREGATWRVSFYVNKAGKVFYEQRASYGGLGAYTTPLAMEISDFKVEIRTIGESKILKLSIISIDQTRELDIWCRNLR